MSKDKDIPMVSLKDFVTNTINQVHDGYGAAGAGRRTGTSLSTTLKFDIAVTTTKDTETEGGIGIFVGAFGLGSRGKSGDEKETRSRIHFEVPVVL